MPNVYCTVQTQESADAENLFSLVMDMPTWKAKCYSWSTVLQQNASAERGENS